MGFGYSPCLIKNRGDEEMTGTFEIYSEDTNGRRTRVAYLGSTTNDPGAAPVLSVPAHGVLRVPDFAHPADAARYVVVFRGKMGLEEDAVAGKVIAQSWLAMTLQATYRADGLGNGWASLTGGPLNFDPWVGQQVRFSQGVALENDVMFASFGVGDGGRFNPVWKFWRTPDGDLQVADIATSLTGQLGSRAVLDSVTSLAGNDLRAGFYYTGTSGYFDSSLPGGVARWNEVTHQWDAQASFALHFTPGVVYAGTDPAGTPALLAHGAASTDDPSWLTQSRKAGAGWTEVRPIIDGKRATCASEDCYTNWDATTMAWNYVDGEGDVMLAGGTLYWKAYGPDGWINHTSYGMWKSLDRGQSWRQVFDTTTLDLDFNFVWGQKTVVSVALAPTGEALATVELNHDTDPMTGSWIWPKLVYASQDAGQSWALASQPEGQQGPNGGPKRQTVGVIYLSNVLGGP